MHRIEQTDCIRWTRSNESVSCGGLFCVSCGVSAENTKRQALHAVFVVFACTFQNLRPHASYELILKVMKIISLVFVALSNSFAAAITPQQGGQQIVQYFTSETKQQASQGETWLRMAHAKPHGCVQAYVTVNENIPSSLQQGIFATPGYEYQAFIRFSNGVGRGFTPLLQGNESDAVPDIRGFGLKIFNCAGSFPNTPSVDFQFTTSRVSFLPDVPSAVSFFNAVFQGNLGTHASKTLCVLTASQQQRCGFPPIRAWLRCLLIRALTATLTIFSLRRGGLQVT